MQQFSSLYSKFFEILSATASVSKFVSKSEVNHQMHGFYTSLSKNGEMAQMLDLGHFKQVYFLLQAQRSLFVDLVNLKLLGQLRYPDENLEVYM